MSGTIKIESVQNPQVKRLQQLYEKSRNRKKEGVFVIEGVRECSLAIQANYIFEKLYYCAEFLSEPQQKIFQQIDAPKVALSKEVYQKITYRGSTEGILAIAYAQTHTLDELTLPKNPLILVAESIEKPGNLGAIFRTADAVQVDAVLIAQPTADIYNPNVIRSSVGCVFTNQVAIASSEEIIAFLKKKNIHIYSAILQEAQPYDTQDYSGATALVVGTESTGLSQIWREHSTQNIIIPMQGVIDSMNVSVAAAVLLFEAKRQRK